MRLAFVVVVAALLWACSDDTPAAPANATESAETVAKNCADPQWKDKNLGLWYSVCRRPMSW
jgi:outer membrane biogenesis lipoprotein LolB